MKNEEKSLVRKQAANFITLLNMLSGSISILASLSGRYKTALAMIWIAAIADRFDGKVARMLGTDGELGVQMDSMGDVISFGIAPAINVYVRVFLKQDNIIKTFGGIVTVLFMCAGALRLARYNVNGLNEDNSFNGMPITVGGSLLAVALFFVKNFGPIFYIVIMALFSILELSTIKIKKR